MEIAEHILDCPGDALDHQIAGAVAEIVIDRLEAVEIEDRKRGVVLNVFERLVEGAAIGQAGERIGAAQPLKLRLRFPQLTDRLGKHHAENSGHQAADDPAHGDTVGNSLRKRNRKKP